MSSWAPPFKKANHQFFPVGNRSSVDEQRPDSSHGDDETIVEPDQGNGMRPEVRYGGGERN